MIKTFMRNCASTDMDERWWIKDIERKTFEQLSDSRYEPSQKSGKIRFRWAQMDVVLREMIEATASQAFKHLMHMKENYQHHGIQQCFVTGRQRAKLTYDELDVAGEKLATLIGEQIAAMT